jgi:disulfide bond formation protein DsbB
MNPARASFRIQFLLGFLACAALLAYAFYAQLHDGLEPCPLCIFQRVAFAVLGLVFLAGALHAPRGMARRAYGGLAVVVAGVGAALSGRHIWLQHLPPDEVPTCGPGLDYMLDAMPISGVIRKVLTGSGECAKIDWTFLGLSMPAWTLVCFIVLAAWAAFAAYRRG